MQFAQETVNAPPPKSTTQPTENCKRPFEILGIDLFGPIKRHQVDGNNHILVITDYFPKWVEALPLPDQKAQTTAKAPYKSIKRTHEPP